MLALLGASLGLGAAAAVPVPAWACAVAERSRGQVAASPLAEAEAEADDARRVQANVVRLHAVATRVGGEEGASDELDARALLGDATRETIEAEGQLKAAEAKLTQKVPAVDGKALGEVLQGATGDVLVVFFCTMVRAL